MTKSRMLFSVLALASVVPAAVSAQDKPNIVFVISDDHRWDCIGAAGNDKISTPNMDRLATEGVHFKEATIANSQCAPSRAVLLTGMASHANGYYSNQTATKPRRGADAFSDLKCLPEALADQGYATAMVGKWHLPVDPWNVGFDKIGTWMIGGAGPYKGAQLAEGKSRERSKTDEFTQVAFGDSAVEILKSHSDNSSTQPLFLWLAFTAPHGPFEPNPEAARNPYEGKSIEDVLPETYEGDVTVGNGTRWVDYVTAITSVDIELGKVFKALDDNKMSSNTVIVFIGDNGFMMGNRGLSGKAVPWDDSIRVPMMIWGPGVIDAKGYTPAVASSLDLPVTFMKLAGGNVPENWQGRDLTPVLEDGKAHGTTWSVTEAPDYNNWKFPGIAYRAVRTTESKLIAWHESTGKKPEFYDIAKDPEEKNNLYADAAYQPKVQALTAVLEQYMKKTDDNWQMRGDLEIIGEPKGKQQGQDDEDGESAEGGEEAEAPPVNQAAAQPATKPEARAGKKANAQAGKKPKAERKKKRAARRQLKQQQQNN